LIGYYLPDIQLSQRGRIEKISIKVAGSIYRACEQARGSVDLFWNDPISSFNSNSYIVILLMS
jgi:hypothetical protein